VSSALVVSVHDVAVSTAPATLGWMDDLDELGVRASLLVVPGPWRGPGLADDPDLATWLRLQAARGHEVAQHGWVHEPPDPGPAWRRMVNQAVCRGAGEFWSLEEGAARARLLRGRTVLWGAGLDPVGFTPPGWLASPASVRALRSLGYGYTTTHRGVHDLRSGRRLTALALSNRPGSPTERLGCEVVRRAARHAVDRGQVVRIALHPDDRLRPGLREATLATIEACLQGGARSMTYAELVAAHAAPVA
jgi:predicted deacetylase